MSTKKPKNQKKPFVVDNFDAYGQIFIENRRYRIREIISLIIVALFAFGFFVKAMQPPIVIVKDNINPENGAKVIAPGNAPEIREQDAKSMFFYAVKKRWGWTSSTVFTDLVEVRDMLTPTMRKAFLAFVNGYDMTKAEADEKKVKREMRVIQWINAKVKNDINLPFEAIDCQPSKEEGAWYCRGMGSIETYPLFGEMNQGLSTTTKVEFRGKLHPFKYSQETPFGMIISYLDAVNQNKGK